ncbi:SPOR domain-containing protein [Sphingomonas sp. BN140010]|uniref:SPOR domain-containing protein n=1 Tax=Sphingomonas arvum TaxID=2992113 RepID=A0ABT3JGZ7_9SPHN|nr:SPOR domain-containing protein [Sphingomonas sp. BN140010]MCW3798345.1 SPOR domain-containing protein [Sphingomonas sp. BN140010]
MATQEQNFPWLEPVEDEDDAPRLSASKMLAGIVLVLLALGLVAGTMFWLGKRNVGEGSGPPELIAAPSGPYKVKPADPGGLDIRGESGTAYATSAGEQTDAQLDLNAVPEEPVARPQQQAAPADAPAAADSQPAAPSGPAGSTIQLGFFPSQAAANGTWESLSGRFPAVAGAGKVVVPYQSGYRLRASFGSAAEAARACQLLKVAGEACFVVR